MAGSFSFVLKGLRFGNNLSFSLNGVLFEPGPSSEPPPLPGNLASGILFCFVLFDCFIFSFPGFLLTLFFSVLLFLQDAFFSLCFQELFF